MVNQQLSPELIDEGAKLIARLDASGPRVHAALWLYVEDTQAWQLIFAVKSIATMGPRVFYKSVQRAMTRNPKLELLTLEHVKIVAPMSPLIGALRAFRVEGLSRIRITNSSFNGFRFADALIYRSMV